MPDIETDVLVIGAGQAGLAAGFHLSRAGLGFRIVDKAERIGDSWRRRYDSLTLFTPRAFSALPGLALAGDPDGYPSRDEFAEYLETYAGSHSLPVMLAFDVESMMQDEHGFRAAQANGIAIRSRNVVIATGGFQKSLRPQVSASFGSEVLQLDPETYRNSGSIPSGRVLVVGDGASGRDIASELALNNEVWLATGKPRRLFPERVLGKSVWWWLNRVGLMRASPGSVAGRIMRKRDPFPDRGRSLPALLDKGVRIAPRLVASEGRLATFSDGTRIDVDAVIWAIGYRDDFAWLNIAEAAHADGSVRHSEGVSPVPGLYFVGRPWQRNRSSALVMGAGDDAEAVVASILKRRGPRD